MQNVIKLPFDLMGDSTQFDEQTNASSLIIDIPSTYLDTISENELLPEVIAIQRLISLSRLDKQIRVIWNQKVAAKVFDAPNLFPLLAVLICLDNVSHELQQEDGSTLVAELKSSRQLIYKYSLHADLFSDTQILICADSRGHGRPSTLYSEKSNELIARADFDSLVDRLLVGQVATNISASQAVKFSQAIATIVAELFENTDLHGKVGLNGAPFKLNGIRGLIFKRIKIEKKVRRQAFEVLTPSKKTGAEHGNGELLDALEISVFDSGVGFYSAYTKQKLTSDTPLASEWEVVHKCLERHYEIPIHDTRPSHRAMGLYEVLRALQTVLGLIEVRSGRAYGFRTFLEGDWRFQREPQSSTQRPGMPKPVLLDVKNKFVTVPTPHEHLTGVSIRVLIPLN